MGEIEVGRKKQVSWSLPVYIAFLAVLGALLAYRPMLEYCTAFFQSKQLYQEAMQLVVLSVIMALCRSLPVPTRTGDGMDISNVAVIASFLAKGPGATISVLIISAFFTFDRHNNKISHVFNTPVSKTLFNNFNLIISLVLGSYVFSLAGGKPTNLGTSYYDLSLPQALGPSLLYLVVSLLAESIFMAMLLMILRRSPFWKTLSYGLKTFTPTLLALSPIGYFIAYIFTTDTVGSSGPYMALLFFVPLMFARYAFKLYLDSKEQYLRTISTLTAAIEAKDEYTEGHSKRVAQLAVEIAQALGLRSARIENIKVASVLHDIGKIGIDDKILRKPSKLTKIEWGRIMEHPAIGVKILEDVTMPEAVKEMIYYHHVRYDHGGYPSIGKKVRIPLEVHIIGLADAYDAMTSNRPYRSAMTEEMALEVVKGERGKQFHPDIVDAFLKLKKKV
jgi:putative nucleotidyltransferase with HDIG domain